MHRCVDALLCVISDLIRADQKHALSSSDDVTTLIRLLSMYLEHGKYPSTNAYSIINSSLFILESIVRSRHGNDEALDKDWFPVTSLVRPLYLYGNNIKISAEVLSSFNTIYTISSEATQSQMRDAYVELKLHKIIYQSVLVGGVSGQKIPNEVHHQLHLMQIILMNGFYGNLMCKIDAQDHNSLESIKELRKVAFDGKGGSTNHLANVQQSQRAGRFSEDYKILGFTSHLNPSQDFQKSYTGSLALNLMTYFAKRYTDKYISFVLDNSNCCGEVTECPFAAFSIKLVDLIF